MKVDAAIENARRSVALRPRYGSFAGWLAAHDPQCPIYALTVAANPPWLAHEPIQT